MIPTFDVSNLINRAIKVVVAAVANPLVIIVGVSATLGTLAAVYINVFDVIHLPDFELLPFDVESNGWVAFVCYLVDYRTVRTVVSFGCSALITSLTLTLTFLGSLLIGYWVLNVARAIRSAAKDL